MAVQMEITIELLYNTTDLKNPFSWSQLDADHSTTTYAESHVYFEAFSFTDVSFLRNSAQQITDLVAKNNSPTHFIQVQSTTTTDHNSQIWMVRH